MPEKKMGRNIAELQDIKENWTALTRSSTLQNLTYVSKPDFFVSLSLQM
jgi:hypothetical protein